MGTECVKIKLKHNSPEWLDFRKSGIGGSDAAAILGFSPYKSNVDVWEEKVGLRIPEDISDKPHVQYGKSVEDLLVKMFSLDFPEYQVRINKDVVYIRGFMFASLDAEIVDKATNEEGGLEIKSTEIFNPYEFAKWNKQIPEYYYAQILHYLIVTGRSFYKCNAQIKHRGENGEIEKITRNYTYMRKDVLEDLKYLYLKEKEFWGYVQRKEKPPLILPRI